MFCNFYIDNLERLSLANKRFTYLLTYGIIIIIIFSPTSTKPVGLKIKLGYLLVWNGPLGAKNVIRLL